MSETARPPLAPLHDGHPSGSAETNGSAAANGAADANGAAVRRLPLALLLLVALVGVGVAAHLVGHKLGLTLDPSHPSRCVPGALFDCDRVNVSAWSELFGLPIALYGVPVYALVAWLALVGLRRAGAPDPASRSVAQGAVTLAIVVSGCAVLVSVLLAGYSAFLIGAFCPYCVALYAVSTSALVLAFLGSRRPPFRVPGDVLRMVRGLRPPLVGTLVVAVVSAGVTGLGYVAARSQLRADLRARLPAELGDLGEPLDAPRIAAADTAAGAAAPSPATAAVTASGENAAPPTAAAAEPPPGVSPLRPGVPDGQRTDNGDGFEPEEQLAPLRAAVEARL
jgi:uncharacterized membrane protein